MLAGIHYPKMVEIRENPGKAMSERIYRSVGELYLDWIFSCINRGKIITW